jgi:hypothetical protein
MRNKYKTVVFALVVTMVISAVPAAAIASSIGVRTQLMSSPTYYWPVTSVMVGTTIWDWAAVTYGNDIVTGGEVWFDVKVPSSDTWVSYGTPKDVVSEWTVSDAYTVDKPGTYYFRARYGDYQSGDCDEALSVASIEVCETAWAAESVGTHRFVDRGNWGTYVHYSKGQGEATYPLYAGQKYYAGDLVVWMEGTSLFLEFRSASTYAYKPGTMGQWSVIETHVAVGNQPEEIPRNKPGNPIPGQFAYSWIGGRLDRLQMGPINVGNLSNEFVIAAHAVMMWAGYNTP